MYNLSDYLRRGSTFIANNYFSGTRLSTLMFYATDICDSRCKHCLIWAKRPTQSLPLEKIIEVMNSKCVTKHTQVGLEGGEFLLHNDAFAILQWFENYHPKFDLLSNCLQPNLLIEAIKKHPPRRLYISLDGNQETYSYMRGRDGYDSVISVIEQTRHLVPISVMFTLSPYNDFEDMKYVAAVCKKYEIDLRVGIYNNIQLFDTLDKAHETDIGQKKNEDALTFRQVAVGDHFDGVKQHKELETADLPQPKHALDTRFSRFKENIPAIIKDFKENYDFLVLYDEWRHKQLKLKCFSIMDSLVIHPNGDVPICQNLNTKLGNIYNQSLDEILEASQTKDIRRDHRDNCNQCWINFHRKYDVILYRSFEQFFGPGVTSKVFGYYQWEADNQVTYNQYLERVENDYAASNPNPTKK
jgi:MoaA/NifB/PqqE/SkfB family radical SAM enzyme